MQTNDINRTNCLIRQLDPGTIYINKAPPSNFGASPFGGVGLSGFGREGGRAGLKKFIKIKSVGVSRRPLAAPTAIPFRGSQLAA